MAEGFLDKVTEFLKEVWESGWEPFEKLSRRERGYLIVFVCLIYIVLIIPALFMGMEWHFYPLSAGFLGMMLIFLIFPNLRLKIVSRFDGLRDRILVRRPEGRERVYLSLAVVGIMLGYLGFMFSIVFLMPSGPNLIVNVVIWSAFSGSYFIVTFLGLLELIENLGLSKSGGAEEDREGSGGKTELR